MKAAGYIFSILIFLFLAGPGPAHGQMLAEMCNVRTLSIDKVQGQITLADGRKGFPEIPFARTRVTLTRVDLRPLGEPDVIVATVETDDKGLFEINGVARGTYRMSVHYWVKGRDAGIPYDFILKVKISNVYKSDKYIYVMLAGSTCPNNKLKRVGKKQLLNRPS